MSGLWLLGCALAALWLHLATAQTVACDPLSGGSWTSPLFLPHEATDIAKGACPPIPGFSQDYSVDFTTLSAIPTADWITAAYEGQYISFSPKGLNFSLSSFDSAPYIWTTNYFQYGTVSVTLQTAPGTGVISSAVLFSDDADEIDWEFSGNDFGSSTFALQTNYFGKGITGAYDRSTQPTVATNLSQSFTTYTLAWLPESLTWSVNGTAVRTLYAADCDNSTHQYPQTPARLHLGVWDGGSTNLSGYVVYWAGGYTDPSGFPYSMLVKSVSIQPYQYCDSYQYTDTSGSSNSVQCLNSTATSTASNGSTSESMTSGLVSSAASVIVTPSSTACSTPVPTPTQPGAPDGCASYYLVQSGDNCATVASAYNVTDSDIKSWNPEVGDECDDLWLNYYICASPPGVCNTTAAQPSTGSSDTVLSTASSSASLSSILSNPTASMASTSLSSTTSSSPLTVPSGTSGSASPLISTTSSSTAFSLPSSQSSPSSLVVSVDSTTMAGIPVSSSFPGSDTSDASSEMASSTPISSASSLLSVTPDTGDASSEMVSSTPISSATSSLWVTSATTAAPLPSWMPSSTGTPTSSTAAARSTSATASSPVATSSVFPQCPSSNGTTYTASTGVQFIIECNTDHPGGDLSAVGVSGAHVFQACIEKCASTSGCVDVSLSGSACYLKKTVEAAVSDNMVWGAKLVGLQGPIVVPTASGYTSLGCHSEKRPSGRALSYMYDDATAMTIELCAQKARSMSANYFGVEYGQQCWYGKTWAQTSVQALDQSQCGFLCPGNASEYCGAGNALQMYKWSGGKKRRRGAGWFRRPGQRGP